MTMSYNVQCISIHCGHPCCGTCSQCMLIAERLNTKATNPASNLAKHLYIQNVCIHVHCMYVRMSWPRFGMLFHPYHVQVEVMLHYMYILNCVDPLVHDTPVGMPDK